MDADCTAHRRGLCPCVGAMQLAMIAGFFTSYPMNWWLIRIDIEARM
jgi:hypothetical protein